MSAYRYRLPTETPPIHSQAPCVGDCRELMTVHDSYGIRRKTFTCETCGRIRTEDSHAPTLGDRHRRMD